MSLQVWFPFDGTIENKGLAGNIELTGSKGMPASWYYCGSKNMLANSTKGNYVTQSLATGTGVATSTRTTSTNSVDGTTVVKFTMSSGTAPSWDYIRLGRGSDFSVSSLTASTSYTISFLARTDMTSSCYIRLQNADGTNIMSNSSSLTLVGDGNWHKYSATVKTISDLSTITVGSQIIYFRGASEPEKYIEINKVKFEYGTAATEWTPLYSSSTHSNYAKIQQNGKTGRYCAAWTAATNAYNLHDKNESDTLNFGENDSFSWSCWLIKTYAGTSSSYAFGVANFAESGQGWGVRINSASTITAYFGTNTTSISLANNTWVHLTYVYDAEAKKVNVYKDGELYKTANVTSGFPSYVTASGLSLGGRYYNSGTTNSALNGALNDFRVYDHALSISEIKELYKSLVLHYKLTGNDEKIIYADPDTETVEPRLLEVHANLIGKENITSDEISYLYNSKSGDYTSYKTAKGTDIYRMDSSGWISIPDPTAHFGTINAPGCYNNCGFKDIQITPGYYYITIWTDAPSSYTTHGLRIYNKANPTSDTTVFSKWGNNVSQFGTPGKHSFSFSVTSAMTIGISMSVCNDYRFKIKLEKYHSGGSSTPWIPSSFCNCVDCSGHEYNAKFESSTFLELSTPVYSDSGLYGTSARWGGVRSIPVPLYNMFNQDFTISFWVKPSSLDNSTGVIFCWKNTIGFKLYTNKSNLISLQNTGKTTSSTLTLGTLTSGWNHVVYSYKNSNGTWSLKCYINNALSKTSSGNIDSTIISDLLYSQSKYAFLGFNAISGNSYTDSETDFEISTCTLPFLGRILDFRIYATDLSEADIEELYKVKEKIDKDGNIYGKELRDE